MSMFKAAVAGVVVASSLVICGDARAQPIQWGENGDVPVPRDYNNDGYTDIAVWRPANGNWYVRGQWPVQWGAPADRPVPADFDGDHRPDFVIWRPGNGEWWVKNGVTGAVRGVQWGQSGDVPLPGDIDGDGRADFVVFRPSTGNWHVQNSVTGAMTTVQWGQAGDVPLVGDYDGFGGDDLTVWRPSTGEWWTRGGITGVHRKTYLWGTNGDIPSTAQFLCSRKAGQTIWRPGSPARWWVHGKYHDAAWGEPGDIPVAANYVGDYAADIAIWRPSDGMWWIYENQNAPACKQDWDGAATAIHRTKEDVQGVAVAAVKNGQVVFQYGAGMANLVNPATPDIPFQVASISKLFVSTAVLQLFDSGQLHPDTLAVVNPQNYSFIPTLRHLSTHTSGLRSAVCEVAGPGDPWRTLSMAIDGCMSNTASWHGTPPGSFFQYSNLGAAYAARRVEHVTGLDFAAVTRDRIFTPLGMASTKWFAGDFGGSAMAAPFTAPGAPGNVLGFSPYPAGNLRSSVLDLARFMIAWTNDGVGSGGQRILAPGRVAWTLTSMSTVNDFGFFWAKSSVAAREVWGHGGTLNGVCTRLSIDPVEKQGVVILTNGSCAQAGPHIDIIEHLVMYTLDQL